MQQLYASPELEALHLKAMQSLVIETGYEFAVVRQVYEVELARLQTAAHVTDFVVLLSSRRAREALRRPARSRRSEPVSAQ